MWSYPRKDEYWQERINRASDFWMRAARSEARVQFFGSKIFGLHYSYQIWCELDWKVLQSAEGAFSLKAAGITSVWCVVNNEFKRIPNRLMNLLVGIWVYLLQKVCFGDCVVWLTEGCFMKVCYEWKYERNGVRWLFWFIYLGTQLWNEDSGNRNVEESSGCWWTSPGAI